MGHLWLREAIGYFLSSVGHVGGYSWLIGQRMHLWQRSSTGNINRQFCNFLPSRCWSRFHSFKRLHNFWGDLSCVSGFTILSCFTRYVASNYRPPAGHLEIFFTLYISYGGTTNASRLMTIRCTSALSTFTPTINEVFNGCIALATFFPIGCLVRG